MKTITKRADLEALPLNTVLVDPEGDVVVKARGGWGGREINWYYAGSENWTTPTLPATVVYNPEEAE